MHTSPRGKFLPLFILTVAGFIVGCGGSNTVQPPKVEPVPENATGDEMPSNDEK